MRNNRNKIHIPTVDRQQAFRYAGMPETATPDDHFLHLADRCEAALLAAVQPCYCWKVFEKSALAAVLQGEEIARHLQQCRNVILFCATLSQGADNCIRQAQTRDVLAGVLTDAMASALTEQLCDLAEREMLAYFPGYYATSRFSPGYADMPLEVQQEILTLLQAQKYTGVCLTECNLMTPRKSVTAVIGISELPVAERKKGCAACRAAATCPYRKNGATCES